MMKKLLSTIARFTMVAALVTSCSTTDLPSGEKPITPVPEVPTVLIELNIAKSLLIEMNKAATVDLVVTGSENAAEDFDIDIRLTNVAGDRSDRVVLLNNLTVTMKKGQKEAIIKVTGNLLTRSTTLRISTDENGVSFGNKSCQIKVSSNIIPFYWMIPAVSETYPKDSYYSHQIESMFYEPKGNEIMGTYKAGYAERRREDWDNATTEDYVWVFDSYGGQIVGNDKACMSYLPVALNAIIDKIDGETNTMITNELGFIKNAEFKYIENGGTALTQKKSPFIVHPDMGDQLKGDVYIVFTTEFADPDLGLNKEHWFRVWAKINPDEIAAGDYSGTTMFMCLDNDMEFKVGQRK